MTAKLTAEEPSAAYKVLRGGRPALLESLVTAGVEQLGPTGDGEFIYVDISSINNQTKRIEDAKRLPVGSAPSRAPQRLRTLDVLISMTRPNLNAVALVPASLDGAIGSTGFHVLRANEHAEPAWLFYAAQSPQFVEGMSELVQGALYPAVRPKDIRAFSLLVPPVQEQREVVAYLDEQLSRLDASVAALLRAQANLKRYRASVLKAACEGRLVPTEAELARAEGRTFETADQLLLRILAERRKRGSSKGKYKEPVVPDTSAPQELPAGWGWASLDQLFDHVTDGDHQAPPQTDEGIPFLVIGDVRSGTVDLSDPRFVGRAYYESLDPRRKPAKGDILYTLVGSYGIAVPVRTTEHFCIQRHMAILRPHALSPAGYLAHALSSDSVFKQATAVATGTAQMTVPLAGLRRIGVGLPPLAEQHRIVAEADRRLSLIRGAEAQVSANLARAKRLRQSILQAAFASPGRSFK